MGVVIGIDIGGSTTKIVGFNEDKKLIAPMFVTANDPITSVYGAFGKFLDENGLELDDIEKVMITGVGSSYISNGKSHQHNIINTRKYRFTDQRDLIRFIKITQNTVFGLKGAHIKVCASIPAVFMNVVDLLRKQTLFRGRAKTVQHPKLRRIRQLSFGITQAD